MLCSIKNSAQRRYIVRCWMSAGLVMVLSVAAAVVFRLMHPRGIPAYSIAVLPALPILWTLGATGTYLAEERDEFQRNVLVQCLLGGTGGTLAAITIWGYLEDFARVPRLDLIWIYPLFWLFVGISVPVVMRRYK